MATKRKQYLYIKKDFKTKTNKREINALHKMNGSIQEDDMTFINSCALNIGTPKCIDQI